MARQRAIVVVTEGLNPELVARWGPELLPSFHRLYAEGTGGPMNTEFVPYEPPGLFTAFSGSPPGEHGCFSYWAVHSPDYVPSIQDSSTPRRPLLWHRPELADSTVAVINVFGTHPVRPVNGYCVSYPMRATLHACHPRDLPARLRPHGIRVTSDVGIWYSGQSRDQFVPQVLQADVERGAVVSHLLDGRAGPVPDLTIVNLSAIDRVCHFYWQELEPGSPVALEDGAVLRAYQVADTVLGRMLDRVDETTSVLAFSEIGFGPLRAYCSLNDVLAEAGLLTAGPDGRPDWARTRAFEAVQGTHGININIVGRYKHGVVAADDYEAVRTEVGAALRAHVNPRTGSPLVADVLPREAVHAGDSADEAPDLIVVPYDWRYLPLGDQHWAARVNRTYQSGWHRPETYWGGLGPAFGRGAGGGAQLTDVAPTIAHMLGGVDLPGLTGRVLGTRPAREAASWASMAGSNLTDGSGR